MTADREPPGSLSTDELLRRYGEAEDPVLLEEIVLRFEPLARSVARRYHARGEPLEDLTQVAMVGLLKRHRAESFDPERGVRLHQLRHADHVGRAQALLPRQRPWAVHVPRGVKERALELASVTDELSSKLGRSPSLSELAEALHATEEQTLEAVEAYHGRHAAPLEAGSDDDEAGVPALAAVLGAEDVRLEQAEYLTMIAKGVETLSESDRLILYLRFGRDLTQSEIANRVGTSQMQVSRLLRAAIEKIRRVSGDTDAPVPG